MTVKGFHRFVDTSAGPDACWPWTGSFNPWGYGRARIKVDGKTIEVTASRAAYIAANGPIPSSVHVLHSCDNRPCCNPRHLRAGTHLENMADPTGPDPRTDANGCPDDPHHGVDCPGDACRYAADDPRTDAAVGSYGHDCEHTTHQHGVDGCNVPGCRCAFMSWDESAYEPVRPA